MKALYYPKKVIMMARNKKKMSEYFYFNHTKKAMHPNSICDVCGTYGANRKMNDKRICWQKECAA